MVKKLKIRTKVHPIRKEISTANSHIKKTKNCYRLYSIAIVKYFCSLKLTYCVSGSAKQSHS